MVNEEARKEGLAMVALLDNMMSDLEKLEGWHELAGIMHGALEAIIKDNNAGGRVLKGLFLSMMLRALGEEGSSDADIIAARMAMDWKYRVREGFLKDIAGEETSTRKSH